MRRFVTSLGIVLVSATVAAGCGAAASSGAAPRSSDFDTAPSGSRETDGTPDLSRGIDKARLQDPSYLEKLSSVTEKLSAVSSEISTKLAGSPDLVSIGVMPGAQTLVIYWSGAAKSSALLKALEIAKRRGISTLVAPRKVSKSELDKAQSRVEENSRLYNERGVYFSAYGGFAADFDGLKVMVDSKKSSTKDVMAIQSMIESDVRVPVQVSLGTLVF
jgi:hypothetical protein